LDSARGADFNQEFFSRCVRILRQFGFERDDSQTPQELTREAADFLAREKGVAASGEWLAQLTRIYYKLRFGNGQALSEQDNEVVQSALKNLENAIATLPANKLPINKLPASNT
jgi:hypothetical protein